MGERHFVYPGKRLPTCFKFMLYDPTAGLFDDLTAPRLKLSEQRRLAAPGTSGDQYETRVQGDDLS